jgi:hypothetical protein
MELTLTQRWIEYKSHTETKEIVEGTEIEYYGNGLQNRSQGKVELKFGNLVIVWEDTEHDTPLDNSEQTQKILSDCGFY